MVNHPQTLEFKQVIKQGRNMETTYGDKIPTQEVTTCNCTRLGNSLCHSVTKHSK